MIVLMGPNGRLGNSIWAYANVIAFAAEHHVDVLNPTFRAFPFFKFQKYVGTAHRRSLTALFARQIPLWLWRKLYSVNLRFRTFLCVDAGDDARLDIEADTDLDRSLNKDKIVFLSGLFLSASSSVVRQKSLLASFFALRIEFEARKLALIGAARQGADVLVGVHVRQGDYRTYCGGIMYYSTLEYAAVMQSLATQFIGRSVRFLVCSDERQDVSLFSGLNVHVSHAEPVVDMYALSCCDYIVGPNSTFSQWASFIGDVPLHILDFKASEARGDPSPVYQPNVLGDFDVFCPSNFSRYSSRQVLVADFIRPTRWWHCY